LPQHCRGPPTSLLSSHHSYADVLGVRHHRPRTQRRPDGGGVAIFPLLPKCRRYRSPVRTSQLRFHFFFFFYFHFLNFLANFSCALILFMTTLCMTCGSPSSFFCIFLIFFPTLKIHNK